jgi:hypothetical protein
MRTIVRMGGVVNKTYVHVKCPVCGTSWSEHNKVIYCYRYAPNDPLTDRETIASVKANLPLGEAMIGRVAENLASPCTCKGILKP